MYATSSYGLRGYDQWHSMVNGSHTYLNLGVRKREEPTRMLIDNVMTDDKWREAVFRGPDYGAFACEQSKLSLRALVLIIQLLERSHTMYGLEKYKPGQL